MSVEFGSNGGDDSQGVLRDAVLSNMHTMLDGAAVVQTTNLPWHDTVEVVELALAETPDGRTLSTDRSVMHLGTDSPLLVESSVQDLPLPDGTGLGVTTRAFVDIENSRNTYRETELSGPVDSYSSDQVTAFLRDASRAQVNRPATLLAFDRIHNERAPGIEIVTKRGLDRIE